MSELAFQTAFARLLIDGDVRAAAFAGAPLPGLELSEDDALRLRGLDRERVEVYSELLVMNRLAKAMEALPFTTKLLGTQIWPLALAWNRASPPVESKKYDEARSFAYHLLEAMGSRSYGPAYLHDVLVYELNRLELRYTPVRDPPDASRERSAARLAALALGRGAGVYPRQLPHARVLALDHDIEPILQELEEGRIPAQVEPSPGHLVMVADGSGKVQQLAANLPTAAFVSAATGDRSFAEVLAWLAQVFHLEDAGAFQALVASCVELCTALLDQGVIALFDHPAGRDPEVVFQ